MKIIDNKKDYYDYLMGIYGQDEKIVYDRRGSVTYDMFLKTLPEGCVERLNNHLNEIYLKAGDYLYTFVRYENTGYKWEMPEKISRGWMQKEVYNNPRLVTEEQLKKLNRFWKEHLDYPVVLFMNIPDFTAKEYIRPDGSTYFNHTVPYFIDNPTLDGFKMIRKFLNPDEIWTHIYEFIAHRKDKEIIDNRTDIQHLESAGFDKKTSFRKM